MERKALLFGLLQYLSLFATADPDLNRTLMENCIETDVASIEKYTRTLSMVENIPSNAALNSDQLQKSLSPFGTFKTDWTRLYLLRDALPKDSVVKQKFKHILKLLLVAHNQATRFASSSKSTKNQDLSESGTTVSTSTLGNGGKTDAQQPTTEDDSFLTTKTLIELSNTTTAVGLDQENPSTLRSISNSIKPLLNYPEGNVGSVTIENTSQQSIARNDEEKTSPHTDIPITASTGDGVEHSTFFGVDIGLNTDSGLKKTFERSTTRKEYGFSETTSKTLSMVSGESQNSTPSGRSLEQALEKTERTFSHQSSTNIVPSEKTSTVDEYISATTVSSIPPLQSQSLHSSLTENPVMLAKAEDNVDSSHPVTTNGYSTHEGYSSATLPLSSETTRETPLTLSRKGQLSLSTTEENHSIELTPATTPVEASEKYKASLSGTNIPSNVVEEVQLLSNKMLSQSTWDVKVPTEGISSSMKEFSTTLNAMEFSTGTNVWLAKNSTENSSINEKDLVFVTSGISAENKQNTRSSTPWSTFASSSSTDSTTVKHYVHEQSITVAVAKASNLPRQEQHVNEIDASKGERVTEKNTVDDHVQHNTRIITGESTGSGKVSDKPNYIKNPLHTGLSRSHNVSWDFKHRPEKVETNGNLESERTILYESGGNVKNGSMWKSHIVRVPPVQNSIRRFDKISKNTRTYGYQLPSLSPVTTANSKSEALMSSDKELLSRRTNVLMPQKRGSANADIEKLFRWFYTRGKIKPSNKSRGNENDDAKITSQCKKTP